MNNLTAIAALDDFGLIGINNEIPWKNGADMKFFKHMTTSHTVIMGRKTFESLGSKALPSRDNVVMTRPESPSVWGAVECPVASLYVCDVGKTNLFHAIEEGSKVFVIGGAQIYREFLPNCDRLVFSRMKRHDWPKATDETIYFPSEYVREFEKIKDWREILRDHGDVVEAWDKVEISCRKPEQKAEIEGFEIEVWKRRKDENKS